MDPEGAGPMVGASSVPAETVGITSLPFGPPTEAAPASVSLPNETQGAPSYATLPVRYRVAKRVMDIACVFVLLPVLLPLLTVVAVAVKLDSHGPAFFRQTRIGLHRRPFSIWKFRKMRADLPRQGPMLTLSRDSRFTRVGRLLERTKLDELPQIFNVLRGEMSLIGPRPDVPKFVALYPEMWTEVLSVKPGVFGVTQNRYRNEAELYPDDGDVEEYYERTILPQMLELDAAYARHPSLRADVGLLLQGVYVSLAGTVTKSALAARRTQVATTAGVTLLAIAAMSAAYALEYGGLGADALRPVVAATLAGLVAAVVTGAGAVSASSLVAMDVRRAFVFAAVSVVLLCPLLAWLEGGAVNERLAAIDAVLVFLALAAHALLRYHVAAGSLRPGSSLRGLVATSLVFSPVCGLLALTVANRNEIARSERLVGIAALVVAQPATLALLAPRRTSDVQRVRAQAPYVLGAALSAATLSSLAIGATTELEYDVTDVALYTAFFAAGTTLLSGRRNRSARTPGASAAPSRVVVVGAGQPLAAYLSTLDAAGDSWSVASVIDVTGEPGTLIDGYRAETRLATLRERARAGVIDLVVVLSASLDKEQAAAVQRVLREERLASFVVALTPSRDGDARPAVSP